MSTALHLFVRTVHVLGMVVLLGGAASTWYALRADGWAPPSLPARFEWVFWGTLGVMLVTGVGNLGALGAPGPDTRWGRLFTVKLLVVLALVVGSFLRTLVVHRLSTDGVAPATSVHLRWLYAATTGALLTVVALAEVLAHG